jgi:hypothetical protein
MFFSSLYLKRKYALSTDIMTKDYYASRAWVQPEKGFSEIAFYLNI